MYIFWKLLVVRHFPPSTLSPEWLLKAGFFFYSVSLSSRCACHAFTSGSTLHMRVSLSIWEELNSLVCVFFGLIRETRDEKLTHTAEHNMIGFWIIFCLFITFIYYSCVCVFRAWVVFGLVSYCWVTASTWCRKSFKGRVLCKHSCVWDVRKVCWLVPPIGSLATVAQSVIISSDGKGKRKICAFLWICLSYHVEKDRCERMFDKWISSLLGNFLHGSPHRVCVCGALRDHVCVKNGLRPLHPSQLWSPLLASWCYLLPLCYKCSHPSSCPITLFSEWWSSAIKIDRREQRRGKKEECLTWLISCLQPWDYSELVVSYIM